MRYLTAVICASAYMLAQDEGTAAENPTKTKASCIAVAHLVCGRDKEGHRRTYGNECMARHAGIVSIRDGPCKPSRQDRYPLRRPLPTRTREVFFGSN
jgi:hypothetical protein